MREANASLKVTGHSLMVGKFSLVVIGNGMPPILVRSEALHDRITNGLGCFVEDRPDDGFQRFPLDQRNQGTPVTLANRQSCTYKLNSRLK